MYLAKSEKMTELRQKIVSFIEPADNAYETPSKIGRLFLNRSGIDEDLNSEIVKVCHLKTPLNDFGLENDDSLLTLEMFDDGVKTMVDFGNDDMMPHFIYSANNHNIEEILKFLLLRKMKKYGIQFALLTTLRMRRIHLITKEKAKAAYDGKLKTEGWDSYEGSINDDLESFCNDLQNQEGIKEKSVRSFFLPKLTKEELDLVEEKNQEYMRSYLKYFMADVDAEEMKMSDSGDKFVHGRCIRKTFILTVQPELRTYQGFEYQSKQIKLNP